MPIRLDERLSAIAACVDPGSVADIGCDHGKLAYYLISTEKADKVIATDISERSLQKAKELAYANGADIDARLGDGLSPIGDGEVDTVVIAGLGGDVIAGIIDRAQIEGKRFAHYVLSPNTHPEKVRRAIAAAGHEATTDRTIVCSGKPYTVIKTQRGDSRPDALHELFGTFFERDDVMLDMIEREYDMKNKLLAKSPDSEALAKRVEILKQALVYASRSL